MHSMAEDFVNGTIQTVPSEIKKIGSLLITLQSRKAQPEAVWLLDKEWKPVTHLDQTWIKAIVDVHYVSKDVLFIKDYKSGQMYDNHRDQLELYGIMGLQIYPDVNRVEYSAVYMDTGYEGMEGGLLRSMLPKMVKKWHEPAEAMFADTVFEPKVGPQCRWCPYAKAKGGPCEY